MAAAQRIYARALFEAAQDAKRVDIVDRDLGAFAEALDGSPELAAFLGNPQIERAAKIEVVGQIEQASGRTVEATRNVDPSLIGGMILQAGSLRVDASVRGRLERLRRELATTS